MDTCVCVFVFTFGSVQFDSVRFGLVEHLNEVRHLALRILFQIVPKWMRYTFVVSLCGTFLPLNHELNLLHEYFVHKHTQYKEEKNERSNEIYKHAHLIRCNKNASTIIIRPSRFVCVFFLSFVRISIRAGTKVVFGALSFFVISKTFMLFFSILLRFFSLSFVYLNEGSNTHVSGCSSIPSSLFFYQAFRVGCPLSLFEMTNKRFAFSCTLSIIM